MWLEDYDYLDHNNNVVILNMRKNSLMVLSFSAIPTIL